MPKNHPKLYTKSPNSVTAPFNNMRTLTFNSQPTNAFFATANQVFGDSSQLPTTVECTVIKSLSPQRSNECACLSHARAIERAWECTISIETSKGQNGSRFKFRGMCFISCMCFIFVLH